MRRRTECAPHWQGSEPEQRGWRASIKFSKARSRLRPRGGPCCAGPSALQPGGSRRGRPLHELACTRRLRSVAKLFTQFQNALARARPDPIQLEPGAHGRRDFRNTGPRAAARPEPLAVPSTCWRAGGRPRPLWVPAVARALRRARSTGLPRICQRRLPRARALQPCNRRGARACNSAVPISAFLLMLLHAWSTKCRPREKSGPPARLRGRRARADRRAVCVRVCV